MMLKSLVALFAFLHTISAEPDAFWGPGRTNQGCLNTAPLPRDQCAGKVSVCWSPGVRDTDCPGHGLCCFDGCVNLCQAAAPPLVVPVPIRSPLIPVVPLSPVNILVRRATRTPSNPCQPTPCGPNTICTVNNDGNAICNCVPGMIPKPDTITGCGPECVRDPDCPTAEVCLNQRCVPEPDPCNPSPCGPGAVCSAQKQGNRYSNPICRCEPGLIPNPDTITGCKPECRIDPDCVSGYVCDNQRCVEKPDPCDPSPCGPGAVCTVNPLGNAICRCQPGLIPNPDTITGCKPECVVDPDCPGDYICEQQKCIQRPDPCDPSPCGPGALCTVGPSGNPICRCEPGLIPNPDTITGCKPECRIDPDCGSRDYICENQKCVLKPDPCDPSPCGPGTMCMANKLGNPICRCLAGLIPKPDTITGCGPECVFDPDCSTGYICDNQKCVEKPDPCDPNPCGGGAIATTIGDSCDCKCPSGSFGDPYQKCTQGECQRDEECTDQEACVDYYCINPCMDLTCQKEYFCRVIRHVPVCGKEYTPEPIEPKSVFVIGQSYKEFKQEAALPRAAAPSNVFVIGSRHGQGSRSGGYGGSSRGRSPSKSTSNSATIIGSRYRKRRHLVPFLFQL